jgi:uncharacterized protein (TIGR02145 family)
MIEFVRTAFRGFFTVLLLIVVIGCIIAGWCTGKIIGVAGGEGFAIVGGFMGTVVGLLVIVIFGGVIATFLHMDEKLVDMCKMLQVLTKIAKKQSTLAIETNAGSFTDIRDGQEYRTVKIGGKTWMAQNLNFQPETGNSWCYGNDNSNCSKYGRLYDWNTAKSACPVGWHLPTRREWDELITSAGGKFAGDALKATSGWSSDNGTDDYDFSALPGGYRDSNDSFIGAGNGGFWWVATPYVSNGAYFRYMDYNHDKVFEDACDVSLGYSVRCVAD